MTRQSQLTDHIKIALAARQELIETLSGTPAVTAPERKFADLRKTKQNTNWGAPCAVSNWLDGPSRLQWASVFFDDLKKPHSSWPEEELL